METKKDEIKQGGATQGEGEQNGAIQGEVIKPYSQIHRDELARLVGVKNQDYYLKAFKQIDKGKNKFNFSAVFVTFVLPYRGMVKEFYALLLFFVSYFVVATVLNTVAGIQALLLGFIPVYFVVIVLAVLFYNKIYYKKLKKIIDDNQVDLYEDKPTSYFRIVMHIVFANVMMICGSVVVGVLAGLK